MAYDKPTLIAHRIQRARETVGEVRLGLEHERLTLAINRIYYRIIRHRLKTFVSQVGNVPQVFNLWHGFLKNFGNLILFVDWERLCAVVSDKQTAILLWDNLTDNGGRNVVFLQPCDNVGRLVGGGGEHKRA